MNKIYVIENLKYGDGADIWQQNDFLMQAFETYDDYFEFWKALEKAYPEGIPEEYIIKKIEQQRLFRILDALDELERENLVIKSQNEDGEDVWAINPEVKLPI